MLLVTSTLQYIVTSLCDGKWAPELFETKELQQEFHQGGLVQLICTQEEQQNEEILHPGECIGFLPIFVPYLDKEINVGISYSLLDFTTCFSFPVPG